MSLSSWFYEHKGRDVMIVRNKPNFFKLFFVVQGSVVPLVLPQITLITLIGMGLLRHTIITRRHFQL